MTFKKIPPKKLALITTIFLFIIILPPSAFIFYPNVLLNLTRLSSIFLIFAGFLGLNRVGQIRLGNPAESKPNYSLWQWVAMIWGLEILLCLIFFSTLHTLTNYIPSENFSALATLKFLWRDCGLFPWPLYALLAAIIGYVYFNRGTEPFLSSIMPTQKNISRDYFLKRLVNILVSISTIFFIVSVIATGALQISWLLTRGFGISPSYFMHPGTMLFSLLVFGFLGSKPFSDLIKFMCKQKISIGIYFLFGMLAAGLAIFFLNVAMSFFSGLEQFGFTHTLPTSEMLFHFFAWGWWLGLAPIASSLLVKISRGRTLRSLVLVVLILPIFAAGILWGFTTLAPTWIPAIPHHIGVLEVMPLVGPMLLILILSRAHDSQFLLSGFLPDQTGSNLFPPRPVVKFIKPLLQTLTLFPILYLWFGMPLLSLFFILFTVPCWLVFIWSSVRGYRMLCE